MSRLRAGTILFAFMGLTLPLMPVQAVLVRSWSRGARHFPHWYHKRVCRLMGIRLVIEGEVVRDRPVLLVANHTSWLDIPVLSAVAPVSFVAKKEVGRWPFVSWLARLQRTVFVDRERRTAVGATADEIASRLAAGDTIVLFAEGTSSDGNRVLPFMTSLFGAVMPGGKQTALPEDARVQTLSLVYTHLHGIPLGRTGRPKVGWYGDMEMTSHAWQLLGSGPVDVKIRIGPPVPLSAFRDRKHLAEASEREVRREVVRLLRARRPDEALEIAAPSAARARPGARRPGGGGDHFR
jgi:1-acyl-sn-glycerol-3-phosphate acyltransferase